MTRAPESDLAATVAQMRSNAAEIRSGLDQIAAGFDLAGVNRPHEFAVLHDMVTTAVGLGALSDLADGWAHVKPAVQQSRQDIARHARAVPAVWESGAAATSVRYLGMLDGPHETLESACGSIWADLVRVIAAAALWLIEMALWALGGTFLVWVLSSTITPPPLSLIPIVGGIIAWIVYGIHRWSAVQDALNEACWDFTTLIPMFDAQGKWPEPPQPRLLPAAEQPAGPPAVGRRASKPPSDQGPLVLFLGGPSLALWLLST